MKIRETIIDFATLPAQQKHDFFQQMLEFDQLIFPFASVEQLYQYVHDPEAVSVPVIQYFVGERLIGQNIMPILKLQLQDKPVFVVTSRAGVLEQYRRSNLTLKTAIRVALRYRLRYPAIPLWFVTTLMQPKVYTLFASRSRYFYPRKGYTMPTAHQSVLELMHRYKSRVDKRGQGIYVAPALMPKVTPDQLIRLRKRSDVHYQFFMQHVPDYFDGKGLMCVCRLDFKTISETIMNLAFGKSVH